MLPITFTGSGLLPITIYRGENPFLSLHVPSPREKRIFSLKRRGEIKSYRVLKIFVLLEEEKHNTLVVAAQSLGGSSDLIGLGIDCYNIVGTARRVASPFFGFGRE